MNTNNKDNNQLNSFNSNSWDILASSSNAIKILSRFGFTSNFSNEAIKLTIGETRSKNDKFNVLDIAAGTGPLSLYLSELYTNSDIIASDYSSQMISILNESIKKDNIKNIKTKVEDAMNLKDYEANTFDYVFSIFGVMFFPDLNKGLKELHRVLKPNGKISIATWQKDQYIGILLEETYKKIMNVDKLPFAQPFISLNDKNQMKYHLEQSGFKNIKIYSIDNYYKESNDYNELLLNKGNPVHDDIINLIPIEKRDQFESTLIEIAKSKYPIDPNTNTIKFIAKALISIAEK